MSDGDTLLVTTGPNGYIRLHQPLGDREPGWHHDLCWQYVTGTADGGQHDGEGAIAVLLVDSDDGVVLEVTDLMGPFQTFAVHTLFGRVGELADLEGVAVFPANVPDGTVEGEPLLIVAFRDSQGREVRWGLTILGVTLSADATRFGLEWAFEAGTRLRDAALPPVAVAH